MIERRRPILTGKNAFLLSAAFAVLAPLMFNTDTAIRAYGAALGGSADCPPSDTLIADDAFVLTYAGSDAHSTKPTPNYFTRRTYEAAAIEYVERTYRHRAPKFIIMLNDTNTVQNKKNRNKFLHFVAYHSHHKITVPDDAFVFDNAANTAHGVGNFLPIARSRHIRSVALFAWPNEKRAAIMLC